jgi:SdpI/YhfL family protein
MDLGTIFTLNFLMAVLSVPFLWNLVPRNRFYGFRVPATLRDDEIWYTMNRRVARAMVPVCGALALVAVAFDEFGLDTSIGRNLLMAVTVAAIGAVMFRGWQAANRLARLKQSTGRLTPAAR